MENWKSQVPIKDFGVPGRGSHFGGPRIPPVDVTDPGLAFPVCQSYIPVRRDPPFVLPESHFAGQNFPIQSLQLA